MISRILFFQHIISKGKSANHGNLRLGFFEILEAATKGVLKNFENFTGKHLRWSLFLINMQVFSRFPVKFAIILRTPVFKKSCERPPLKLLMTYLFLSAYIDVFWIHMKVTCLKSDLKTLPGKCTCFTDWDLGSPEKFCFPGLLFRFDKAWWNLDINISSLISKLKAPS